MKDVSKRDLEQIRSDIDQVDRELARLLEKRMALVSEVTDYKRRANKAVLDASREDRVIRNVLDCVSQPSFHKSIEEIFRHMMKVSREYQSKRLEHTNTPPRFGLIGEKLSHSLSPAIHDLFFNFTQTQGSYTLLETPRSDLPELLKKLKAEGYSGVNVTVPYKSEIMPFLDELSSEARHIGAVNTIVLSDTLKGYNTDYHGFGAALAHCGVALCGKRCAVLGSGGSAHAVMAYLEDQGAKELVIVSRDPESVYFKFPGLPVEKLEDFCAQGFDLVVNTTPVGMYPSSQVSPLTKEQLIGAGFVMDLIYNPPETRLLSLARELGIPCCNGLYMLVAQAMHGEGIWLGRSVDQVIVDKIFDEMVKRL
jgi:shikimate dehydrogenase